VQVLTTLGAALGLLGHDTVLLGIRVLANPHHLPENLEIGFVVFD